MLHMIQTGMRLKKLLQKKSALIADQHGIRSVELDILVCLYLMHDCDTATDIMDRRALSKAHISQSVKRLQARQLVTLYADAVDRRRTHLVLTPQACDIARQALAVQRQCEDALFCGISAEERLLLAHILQKMDANITLWGL